MRSPGGEPDSAKLGFSATSAAAVPAATSATATEGALFLDSETGEPEVRKLDPTILADMGLSPPPASTSTRGAARSLTRRTDMRAPPSLSSKEGTLLAHAPVSQTEAHCRRPLLSATWLPLTSVGQG